MTRLTESDQLKLGGDMAHFIEARRDQPRQADDIDLLRTRRLQDRL